MNKQSEALRLADALETVPFIGFISDGQPGTEDPFLCKQAAAELRRLHEVNVELVEALRPIAEHGEISAKIIEAARAAIAKATGEQQ